MLELLTHTPSGAMIRTIALALTWLGLALVGVFVGAAFIALDTHGSLVSFDALYAALGLAGLMIGGLGFWLQRQAGKQVPSVGAPLDREAAGGPPRRKRPPS